MAVMASKVAAPSRTKKAIRTRFRTSVSKVRMNFLWDVLADASWRVLLLSGRPARGLPLWSGTDAPRRRRVVQRTA